MIWALLPLFLISISTGAFAETAELPGSPPSYVLPKFERARGSAHQASSRFAISELITIARDLPSERISKIARKPVTEVLERSRSAKDAQLYRKAAPSVVLIVTKDATGSGSLVGKSGEILTNWHVVRGYEQVGVVLKPDIEGTEPTQDDIRTANVTKYDSVSDLALLTLTEVSPTREPLRLGNADQIVVGADVHAIGHPRGEYWTYTKGVISQFRRNYGWTSKDEPYKHKADVIQTQTPINPGNSGGPLLSDAGTIIGVNSFKSAGDEGLNFAVSVDDIIAFLSRDRNRGAAASEGNKPETRSQTACEPKELFTSRNKANDANVTGFDVKCTGNADAELVRPDDTGKPFLFLMDRNGDKKTDVMIFDFKREGKWEISLWDENFDGHWTLVGYHPNGGLVPSRFESYETCKRRSGAVH